MIDPLDGYWKTHDCVGKRQIVCKIALGKMFNMIFELTA